MHSPCCAERRRGIGAACIGLLLAAALAGSLAALVAALALAEHAAARKSRRESSDTERDLERMNDDLLHDVPLFFFVFAVRNTPRPNLPVSSAVPPDGTHYELFQERCLLESQQTVLNR